MAGIAALTLAFLGGEVVGARRPPPHEIAVVPAVPSAPPPTEAEIAGAQARLQALRTEAESETVVVAALRNQADEARRDLDQLRQQQQAAVAAPPPAPAPLAPAKAAAATPAPPPDRVVLRRSAKIHTGPGKHAPVTRTARRGTVMTVFGYRDGWVRVGERAPWGWVYSGLLTPTS